MRLVVHNHLGGASATGRAAYAKTLAVGRERNKRVPRAALSKTHDCGGDENCSCGCHSHDAQPADYFARVDAHLKTLSSSEAKKKFLRDQLTAFDTRYTNFMKRGGSGSPNESAWTYAETLSGLRSRLGAL